MTQLPELGPTCFLQDFSEELRACLRNLGVNGAGNLSAEDVRLNYFWVTSRFITPRPRRVEVASELRVPPGLKAGYRHVVGAIEAGEDLRRYQSRRLYSLKKKDQDWLLMDWGIQHLHLSEKDGKDGFCEGTREVLFAMFRPDVAYLIDIQPHGPTVWSTTGFLERVRMNWPELLAPFEGPPAPFNEPPPTDAEIQLARKSGVNPLIPLSNGRSYFPSGIGISTAGRPSTFKADKWSALVCDLEAVLPDHFPEICQRFKAGGGQLPDRCTFRLRLGPEGVLAGAEEEPQLVFPLATWERLKSAGFSMLPGARGSEGT